jgi:hypothetical protein
MDLRLLLFLVKLIGTIHIFYTRLVNSRKMKLEIEIEVNVPLDIIEDNKRMKAVEDGLGRSISKGLYEQGVSFKINRIHSRKA